ARGVVRCAGGWVARGRRAPPACETSVKRRILLRLCNEAEALALVALALDDVTPLCVVEVPAHGAFEAALEVVTRPPAELAADLARVDRIAPGVAGAVRDDALKLCVLGDPGRARGAVVA